MVARTLLGGFRGCCYAIAGVFLVVARALSGSFLG